VTGAAILAAAALLMWVVYYASASIGLAPGVASDPPIAIHLPGSPLLAVLLLQIVLMLVSIPVMLLAAAIAEHGKAEERLRVNEERCREAGEADRRLAHAQRLAVVGELTASIAHEINQPLGAMYNNAEAAEMLLDLEHPPLDDLRQILADIRRQDLMASQVVRRMRTLLARHELEMAGVDLNDAIGEVLHLIAGDARRRQVVVASDFARVLPAVQGDRVHLQQVLLNLALNGMDAMAAVPDSRRRLVVRTARIDDRFVEVAVSDSGHGIAAGDEPRLFDSFYTTKKEGMGLGLSIARSIVQAHNGRIWAENNAAGGATFHVALPAAAIDTRHSAV
jgi:signal transduction histidine kinase